MAAEQAVYTEPAPLPSRSRPKSIVVHHIERFVSQIPNWSNPVICEGLADSCWANVVKTNPAILQAHPRAYITAISKVLIQTAKDLSLSDSGGELRMISEEILRNLIVRQREHHWIMTRKTSLTLTNRGSWPVWSDSAV